MIFEPKTIYIDMDGVMAVWQPEKRIEEVAQKGYFRNLPVMENVIETVRKLINTEWLRVCTLSSVFKDKHSAGDKMYWLENNLPEMKPEDIFFVPYGEKKSDYAICNKNSYLLDDLSLNLHDWEKSGGVGIKMYNGINGNNGTWKGFSVKSDMDPDKMYRQIIGILGM